MKNSAILLALTIGLSGGLAFGHGSNNLPEIEIVVTNLVQPSCNGESSGLVSVEAKGGEAPYSYNWNTFPNQFEATAVGLKRGTYFVYVTDSKGNTAFKSVAIEDPSHSILTENKVKSLEDLDLTATVTSTGMNLDYSLDELSIESYMVADLPVGVHKLTVTDANQCVLVQYLQVFELKSEDENEIDASAEFINESGGKILVSKLIPSSTPINSTSEILVKKKE